MACVTTRAGAQTPADIFALKWLMILHTLIMQITNMTGESLHRRFASQENRLSSFTNSSLLPRMRTKYDYIPL